MSQSKRFEFNKADMISLAWGLLDVMVGAGVTYLTTYIGSLDFGVYTPIVVSVWTWCAKLIRKLVSGK